MFLVQASDERWNLPYARNTCPCEGMCLAVWPWDNPILPAACQHASWHMKCGSGRICSTGALVQAQQWDMADWGELHSIASRGMTLLFAAEDTPNVKAKDADLKLSFFQVPLLSEAILPLVVICINKVDVSACFSSVSCQKVNYRALWLQGIFSSLMQQSKQCATEWVVCSEVIPL